MSEVSRGIYVWQPRSAPPGSSTDPRMSWFAVDGGDFRVTLRVETGIAILALDGTLCTAGSPLCVQALQAAISIRPQQLVVDLAGVQLAGQPVPLLARMARICAVHGVPLHITDLPFRLRAPLAARAPAPYRVHPTLPVALRTLTGHAPGTVTP